MATILETPSQRHARYVLTPWVAQASPAMPLIVRGEGAYLVDSDQRRYLDLSSGLVCVNLGHGHQPIVDAIAAQAARLAYVSPQFFLEERAELAQALSELSPWSEGCRTFFTTGGGEANEDALKMARALTGRFKVMSAYRSFHGSAPGAGSVTGENRRWPNEPATMPGVVRFFAPNPYRSPFNTTDPATETQRALDHVELVMTYENPNAIAALIIEPVVGTNGTIVYPQGYLAGLRELCRRHGILLIFDEVMTGFGRTGAPFASQRYDVTPDIITFAKAVTSAYVPLGGAMVRESLAQYFDANPLGAGHTYSGHPVAMAAGIAALASYRTLGLYDRGQQIERWLRDGLDSLQKRFSCIGDVRGIGAFFAIELVKDRATREPWTPWQGPQAGPLGALLKELRQAGAYAFGRYNCIVIAPPLIVTQADIDFGIAALAKALESIT